MTLTPRFPKLLYSYLATEMLAPFFASVVIMNSVFFLVKLIPFLNVVLELEIRFVDFIRLVLYLFPNMFLYSIPMAAMMGVIISFTRLSSEAEILAFKASGVSLYQMIPPVLLVSAGIALLTGFFSTSLIPKSEIAMKQLLFQVAKEKIDKGIKEDQFTEALGDLVVYVDVIDKETNHWKNVWVSDMRGQKNPIIIMAQSGLMTADVDNMLVTITLQNGSLHRPDSTRSQIISFRKYTINIPLHPPTVFDGEDVTKLSTGSMTMAQLQESASIVGRNTPAGRNMLEQYHKRLVLPFGCFILSLLGMPLGLQSGPGKKATGIPLGLAFFILYYILFTLCKAMAEETTYPVAVAMWLPNGIFLLITLFFVRQAAMERPIIPKPITNIFIFLFDKYLSPSLQKCKKLFRKKVRPMAEEKATPSPALVQLVKTKTPTPKPTGGSAYLTEGTVHGNIRNHVFHLPSCELYYSKNCTIEFKNIRLAKESGFEPCRFCKNLIEEMNSRYCETLVEEMSSDKLQ